MKGPKQVEFEYNSDDSSREVIVDHEGTLPCYERADVIMRGDKSWTVTQVLSRQSDSGSNTLMTLSVSLTDRF